MKFTSQSCLKDKDNIPLASSLFKNGLSHKIEKTLIKYDAGTIQATKQIAQATQASADGTSSIAMPLFLSNVMFVFWILINVFQLLNLFIYIDVNLPINVTSFFRSFSSFNFSFLPSFGLSQEETATGSRGYSFFGLAIVDQDTPRVFSSRGLQTSSFLVNGVTYIETILLLHLAVYILQSMRRVFQWDPYIENETGDGLLAKAFRLIYNKLIFTLMITSHQGFLLNLAFAFFI